MKIKSWCVNNYRKILNIIGVAAFGATVTACYGSPYGEYEVKGKVVDQDLNPIKGIAITPDEYIAQMNIDSLRNDPHTIRYISNYTSSEDGTFYINDSYWPRHDKLYAIDIDGPDNGGDYATTEVTFEFVQTEVSDDWFEGRFTARNITIVMKPRDIVPE